MRHVWRYGQTNHTNGASACGSAPCSRESRALAGMSRSTVGNGAVCGRKHLRARYRHVVALATRHEETLRADRPGASHAPPAYKEASVPHVLVLNASYEPLGVVPLRRALILVLNDKAVSLEESGALMHSATRVIPAPSVVRLEALRAGPLSGPRSAHPPGAVRPRRRPVHVLRWRRNQRRPRHPAQPRRPARLGQRGRRLPPLQPRQGRPARRRDRLAAAPSTRPAVGARLAHHRHRAIGTRAGCHTCSRTARTTRWPGSTAYPPETGPSSYPTARRRCAAGRFVVRWTGEAAVPRW